MRVLIFEDLFVILWFWRDLLLICIKHRGLFANAKKYPPFWKGSSNFFGSLHLSCPLSFLSSISTTINPQPSPSPTLSSSSSHQPTNITIFFFILSLLSSLLELREKLSKVGFEVVFRELAKAQLESVRAWSRGK